MTETSILRYYCGKCGAENHPYGADVLKDIPHGCRCVCTSCKYIEDIEWKDSETTKLLMLQKAAVIGNNLKIDPKLEIMENKIKVIEANRDSDRNEIQLLRQTVDLLIHNEIKVLKEQYGDHQFNLNGMNERMKNLEDMFTKIKEIQEKSNGRQYPET